MRFRRVAVAAALITTAVTVPTAALAAPPPAAPPAAAAPPTAAAAPASAVGSAAVRARSRPSRFSANGTVTALSGRAVTIAVSRSGNLTVSVAADARIRVNGRNAAVTDLGAGFSITVNGIRSGSDYVASRIEARGRRTK
ncbi:hypothetical protein GCM10010172_75310 [Paractinoplanes ferrugineus]|uniref:DUF5666 domain-containing protein n=1 Tax=Paractinoplanes ferrugineus TaxID=113564 RepID=A0A919ME63_9ACTN|nr:hypothetical protein [Actinoplanes ferrugineus]GIE11314.1 hypothetical protein Afe05nite_31540 [Actinoplanes ferrugineus]